MTVTIRPRDDRDLTTLAEILVRVHARDGYPVEGVADPRGWITPAREIASWTALLNGDPIGNISLTRATADEDAAELWQRTTGRSIAELVIPVRLFIDPEHRNHGAGTQLMTTATEYAGAYGLAVAFDVMLKDHDAIRLYEKMGCRRIGTTTHIHSNNRTEPAAVYIAT